jgi:hypothetical protein
MRAYHICHVQSYARERLLSLNMNMLVPSLLRLKDHREFASLNRVVVGAQVIQNVKSTNEYNERFVFEDFSGMT